MSSNEINPYLHIGLTTEFLAVMAETIIHWSYVDEMLVYTLSGLYGIRDLKAQRDLVYPLDTRKKLELLTPDPFSELLSELRQIASLWQSERNLLAHGIPTHKESPSINPLASSFASTRKGSSIEMHEVERYLEHARYAVNVASGLAAPNFEYSPLPERPE